MPERERTGHPGDNADRIEPREDLAVATGDVSQWKAWARWLVGASKAQLQAAGLALLLGAAFALLSLYAFAQIADEVAEQETMELDTAILLALQQHQSAALDTAAQLITLLGNEGLWVLLVVALAFLGWQRRWGAAGALLVTTGGAQILNNVLKALFQRTRPTPLLGLVPEQAYSFPSGHAMLSAAFYTFLGYIGWRVLHGWVRWFWVVSLMLIVLAIGWSRMYLGVHYFTDVVAGYLAGFLWADAVIIATQLMSRRHHRLREVPQETADEDAPVPIEVKPR